MKVDVVTARGPGIAGPTPAESARLPIGPVASLTAARDAPAGATYQQVVARGELDAALRTQVPRQGSPMALLANLAWLASTPEGEQAPLPAAVREAALALWRTMAGREELCSPAGLRAACVRSGVALEATLASLDGSELTAVLSRDWKALLLRLRAVLAREGATAPAVSGRATAPVPSRHAPMVALQSEAATLAALAEDGPMLGELSRQTSDSIARVCCNQLAGIPDDSQRSVPWLLEIPVRLDDRAGLLRLAFERGARADEPGSQGWRVEFAIELAAAGPLRGRVGLAGDRVEVMLYARSPALAAALEGARDELREALSVAGFQPDSIVCLRDHPPETERSGSWLVDLRA